MMWCVFVLAPEAAIAEHKIFGPYRSYDKVERAAARIERLFPDAGVQISELHPDIRLGVEMRSFAEEWSGDHADD